MHRETVILCILDGWGHRDAVDNNAIKLARTPTYDRLWDTAPRAWLKTSGRAVGLPDGQMGNSEVGHMNLGSGRVIQQDLPRINDAIADGSLGDRAAMADFIAALKASGGTAHVMGLLSPGGVHSHQDHMAALVRLLDRAGIPVAVHAFLDGRDTAPQSAGAFLGRFTADIADTQAVVATLSGRYFAMDRDKRWNRVANAYHAVAHGAAARSADCAASGLKAAYDHGETDEFVTPTSLGGYAGMTDGDGLLMANFRSDRARQILTALTDPAFDGFERGTPVHFAATAGMVEYSSALNAFLPALFPPVSVTNSLGEVLADRGIPQLRIAETEKYAHVTFFFNGGVETVFPGEDRVLVPSPDVATYDLKPEMSAPEVTDKLVQAIESGRYGAIIVNFANPDMVGHTGVLTAAIKAVETIDTCLSRLEQAVAKTGGAMLVTADHGNVEQMLDPETGAPHTAHTSFDVPVLLVNRTVPLKDGCLADVAPTVLALMGLDRPAEMTGHSLLAAEDDHAHGQDAAPREDRAAS